MKVKGGVEEGGLSADKRITVKNAPSTAVPSLSMGFHSQWTLEPRDGIELYILFT